MSEPTTPNPTLIRRLAIAGADIKLAHSVFALPFAVLAGVLASTRPGAPGIGGTLTLIVVCMVAARTFAMLVNRIADASLDAANPRTAGRAFARGTLTRRDGLAMLGACAFVFVAATSLFGILYGNWWPLVLSLPVLGWIGLYSFTKRVTALCHVFLGGALAASPIAAAIAVDPGALGSRPEIVWIAGMVLLWVAGFDVIYALQDMEHDQGAGLHSVPSKLGWRRAVIVSRVMHMGALFALGAAWRVSPYLDTAFLVGCVLTCLLLVVEHAVLERRGRAGIPMAFFTLNGVISLVLGASGVIDTLLA